MRKIIIVLVILCILILTSCTQPSEIKEPSVEVEKDSTPVEEVTKETEDIPTEEVIPEVEEEIPSVIEKTDKTVLYIDGEDWKTLVSLEGFKYETGLEGPYTKVPSRFLIQKRDSDLMEISIFAEKIKKASDSEACMLYYLPTVKEARDMSEAMFEVMDTTGSVSEVEKENNFILTYEVDLNLSEEQGVYKTLNHYRYYDSYCFDFHISQTGFQGNMTKFYDIINSIEFVEGVPPDKSENVYIISSIEKD